MAKFFYQVLSTITYFKIREYEQALIESFLKFDELLKLENVNSLLKNFEFDDSDTEAEFEFVNFTSIPHVKRNFLRKRISNHLPSSTKRGSSNSSSSENSTHSQINNNPEQLEKEVIDRKDMYKEKKTFNLMVEIEAFAEKREVIKENNEFLQKKNYSFFSESSEEHNSIYSFGGVLLDESNQKITDNLASLYMGTTANVILIKKHHFYIANVGDSLSVLYKNGKAIRLNIEHKTDILGEKNRIINSGLRIINNRIEGKLNLTRAIGNHRW